MIRVLQVVDHMSMGGIQTFIMNVYRHIDRSQIQFDFLLHHQYDQPYYHEITELGGKLYYIVSRREGVKRNKKELETFFKKHTEYDIVHMHASSLSYLTPLKIAKKYGVKKRIIHSHSSNIAGGFIHKILHWWYKRYIYIIATDYLACGELSSKWMYGGSKVEGKTLIVYNGIDIQSFSIDAKLRMKIRKEIGITDDEIVMGHIGRFNPVKNHHFIIEIFKELLLIFPTSRLLLIGEGPLEKEVEEKVVNCGVSNRVSFLGLRTDISSLLQAIDVFVLPSFYEGFPIVAIEAQAAGVPVVMSDTISKEVVINDNVKQMSIQLSAKEWAQEILNISYNHLSDNHILYEKGFDISCTVNVLSSLYKKNYTI